MRFALMKVKTGLCHIMSRFEVAPCKDTPLRIVFEPKSVVLRMHGEIRMSFNRLQFWSNVYMCVCVCVYIYIYKVIKNSPCTCWFQYRKWHFPLQSPGIYWNAKLCSQIPRSVKHGLYYVCILWCVSLFLRVFLYCNHQLHRDSLIILYIYIYIYIYICRRSLKYRNEYLLN
jgi:hypothetical protein